MKPTSEIQADFDRIALTETPGEWNHNNHYHNFLLRHVPAHCHAALEVGCGTGLFSRLLAQHAETVLALDISPVMLRLARETSSHLAQVAFVQADALTYPFPVSSFDCIASIATLHHMPLAQILPKLSDALAPGGVLLVLDLCRDETLGDFFQSIAAFPVNRALARLKNGNRRPSAQAEAARAAWDAHGHDEIYPSLREVRAACADLLPGAQIRRHFFWRYSLIWTKPAA